MGIFSKLFGSSPKNAPKSNAHALNKNNVCDVCYALGCLAGQVGTYDTCYVQAKVDSDKVIVQTLLDKDYCVSRGITNLNTFTDLLELGVPYSVANFISSLDGKFSCNPYYSLEVSTPNNGDAPSVDEITDAILRSHQTVSLTVNYNVLSATNGIVMIQISD